MNQYSEAMARVTPVAPELASHCTKDQCEKIRVIDENVAFAKCMVMGEWFAWCAPLLVQLDTHVGLQAPDVTSCSKRHPTPPAAHLPLSNNKSKQ